MSLCRDLSSNNLSGQLPPSLESLSSLTTLWVIYSMVKTTFVHCFIYMNKANLLTGSRLQNNQLSGTLDVLQDLPLKDLYSSQPFLIQILPVHLFSPNNLAYGALIYKWFSEVGGKDVAMSCFADFLSLSLRNVENNNFSGPIPDMLLSIPKFKWEPNYMDFDLMLPFIYLLGIDLKACTLQCGTSAFVGCVWYLCIKSSVAYLHLSIYIEMV